MVRLAELGLLLAPFALLAAWWLAGARASRGVLAAGVVLLVLLAAATLWLGNSNRLPAGSRYVPAAWQHGVVVPGHGS